MAYYFGARFCAGQRQARGGVGPRPTSQGFARRHGMPRHRLAEVEIRPAHVPGRVAGLVVGAVALFEGHWWLRREEGGGGRREELLGNGGRGNTAMQSVRLASEVRRLRRLWREKWVAG